MAEYARDISDRVTGIHLPSGIARLGTWALACIGLGMAVAVAPTDGRAVRGVAIVVGVLVIGLLVRFSLPRTATALAVGLAAGIVDAVVGPTPTSTVFGALLFVFVVLGASLSHELAALAPEWELDDAALPWAEQGNPPVLDLSAVSVELNRARRYERPLTVLSIALPALTRGRAGQRAVADLAASLAACLRQSDMLGHQGKLRLLAVLPETTGEEAELLIHRLVGLLPPDLAETIRFGVACFPDEEVTWVGLDDLAREREKAVGRPPFFGEAADLGYRTSRGGSSLLAKGADRR